MFQSLLHQGISLLYTSTLRQKGGSVFVSIPSSSGHQFTVLHSLWFRAWHAAVSIPSSSGHQFTELGFPACRALSIRFQSLLHQGISLLMALGADASVEWSNLFQSLLHQDISLLADQGIDVEGTPVVFQSLLHQGISLLKAMRNAAQQPLAWFQSLLHQGISLLDIAEEEFQSMMSAYCFNPFFIRASVYWPVELDWWEHGRAVTFQSLLHQGISLLRSWANGGTSPMRTVSIPSSSGHQFTDGGGARPRRVHDFCFNPFFIRASVYWAPACRRAALRRPSFNPFFIRASVYCSSFHFCSPSVWSLFQSLLHQGISLLRTTFSRSFDMKKDCFNPFFIRASVYCWAELVIEGTDQERVSIPSSSGHQFTGCA